MVYSISMLAKGTKLNRYVLFYDTENGFKAKVFEFRCKPENFKTMLSKKWFSFVANCKRYGLSIPMDSLYVHKDWSDSVHEERYLTGDDVLIGNYTLIGGK